MLVLVFITIFLIDGFEIATVDATMLSDDEKKSDLLDTYKSRTAAISGLANVLLPLFFLSVWAKAIQSPNQSKLATWIPIGAGFALAWMLGQGLSALNVQITESTYESIIQSSDLVDSSGNNVFEFSTSSPTQVSGIPSTDTILRSAIHPQFFNSSTSCSSDGGPRPAPEVSVRFGFPLNPWLGDLLSESVQYDDWSWYYMDRDYSEAKIGSPSISDSRLNQSAELFTYGFWTMWQHFGKGWTSDTAITDIFQSLNTADETELVRSMQAFIANATSQLEDDLESGSGVGTGAWLNISVPNVTIEFMNIQLSPLIKFEAVTFNLPVKDSIMRAYLQHPNDTDVYWEPGTSNACNDHACVLSTAVEDGAYRDQIRLLPLCISGVGSTEEDLSRFSTIRDVADTWCQFRSNSSVLVFSIAHHISVDDVNYSMPEYHESSVPYARFKVKNPRKTYSVTVGRLSWETTDLAEQYGAKCGSGANCSGLYFPLSNGEQHLVLGESQIPRPNQPFFTSEAYEWEVLALAQTQTAVSMQGDVIYPPAYSFTTDSDEWTQLSGGNCSYLWSPYINAVMQNHLYSTESVQPAYTAAMFWLFQNAALRDFVKATEGSSEVTLAFDGNIPWLSSRVSIPLASAIIMLVGLALVLVLGLLTMHCGRKQAELSETTAVNSEV